MKRLVYKCDQVKVKHKLLMTVKKLDKLSVFTLYEVTAINYDTYRKVRLLELRKFLHVLFFQFLEHVLAHFFLIMKLVLRRTY